jgi:hypothetical protein
MKLDQTRCSSIYRIRAVKVGCILLCLNTRQRHNRAILVVINFHHPFSQPSH